MTIENYPPWQRPALREALERQRRYEMVDRLHWTLGQIDEMERAGYGDDLLAMLWYFSKKAELEEEKKQMGKDGQTGTGPVH